MDIKKIIRSKKLRCPEVKKKVDITISTGRCAYKNKCKQRPDSFCPLYVERLIKTTAKACKLCKK